MTTYLGVFVGVFAFDFLWAACVKYTSQGHAIRAASVGTAMHILQALVTLAYVNNPWCVIPAALGGFAGVYCGIRWPHE